MNPVRDNLNLFNMINKVSNVKSRVRPGKRLIYGRLNLSGQETTCL